jgi:prepilin-type N-terminal cleavage/methylation domain-containing protein
VRRTGFTLIELMIVLVIIAVIVAIAVPNLISSRKSANEGAAIGHLKTLANAQTLFREGDKDGDNFADFGNLQELSNTSIIDGSLGSGKRTGYNFDTDACTDNVGFLWFAVANPSAPYQSGERYFCTNHRGQIYYTNAASIAPDYVSGAIPSELQLVR